MYYKETKEEVLSELDSSINGLSKKEAAKRLNSYGPNVISNHKKNSKLLLLFKQFQDSMVIMLLIVSLISFIYSTIIGESYADTLLILAIVILNVFMGFFQESRAEASLASLKKVDNSKVKVKRDNEEVLSSEIKLVPGDIIILEAGNKIPADCRVIESYSAKVDESILTGESVAVSKSSDPIEKEVLINDRTNMIYSGCNIINGKIVALVTATGMNTELGRIAKSITDNKDIPTPLQKKISEISKNLSVIIIFIISLVFLYNILIMHNNIISVIMLCISLMVSAVPEGLPAVISISLSLGVKELAKKNTLVRTLSSIETLGAVEVICSDKTGTITQNKMTITKFFSNGKFTEVDNKNNSDWLNLLNMVLCNNSNIGKKITGDPTETAMIEFAIKSNAKLKKINFPRKIEISFDSERKLMSTVNRVVNEDILFTKGSLESILSRSKFYLENGKLHKLSKLKKEEFLEIESSLAHDALRVIAFAYKKINESEYINKKNDELLNLEEGLIFTGMVGMIDPPRDNVKESINMCKEAGITPIMITGDSLNTALAISKNIGLIESDNEGIEGKELAKYSDAEMVNLVKKYHVYARVSPNDKVRIVSSWQKNNKVVAMTGDGVNDAPAIKLAHIGIGMGKGGTEVTKSVSDILLLDDCFNTIVAAIKEGRRIYNNIRNVILYSLSSNFAEIALVIIGMLMNVNILLPIHILYIDLVTDAILSICLAFEKSSKNVMKEPPHKSSNKFFTPFMTAFLIISSVIEVLIIYIVYRLGLYYYGATIAQSMAFLCLVAQEMIFAYSCRNLKEPIIKHGLFSNRYVNVGFIMLILLQVIIFITPFKNILHIITLNINQLLIIILINILAFVFLELLKPIITKKFKD